MNTNEQLEILIKKIEYLTKKVETIEHNAQKMSDHIDFINESYEKYKTGLEFVQNIFSRCK